MNRRDAIKTLMAATGGFLVLPAWAVRWNNADIPGHEGIFSELEFNLISAIADTFIPSNGEIGALSVEVDTFLAGLISVCYETDFQNDVKKHLHALDDSAQKSQGKSFVNCIQSEREKLLLAMDNEENENEHAFFSFMKSQSIRGFETSEKVMVKYHGYVMAPGFYDGNADVKG